MRRRINGRYEIETGVFATRGKDTYAVHALHNTSIYFSTISVCYYIDGFCIYLLLMCFGDVLTFIRLQ